MAVNIRFDPAQVRRGQRATVIASTALGAGSIEIWIYSQPDVAPVSETGWYHLGTIPGQSGTLTWDTGRWNVGQYAVAAVVKAPSGAILAHWNAKYTGGAVVVTPMTVAILPPAPGAPPPQPEPPIPPPGDAARPPSTSSLLPIDLSGGLGIALVIGAIVGGWFLVKSMQSDNGGD